MSRRDKRDLCALAFLFGATAALAWRDRQRARAIVDLQRLEHERRGELTPNGMGAAW
jgi:hypothetical protein